MAKKGAQVVLQEEINNNDDWVKMLEKSGIYVVDVYAEWCGPCIPMIANLKKIKLEIGNENLHYAVAKSDNIMALERFRQKSEPHWLFFFDGNLVNLIIGSNAPRLMNLITDEVEQYVKFKNGEIQREFIPMNQITEEEKKKMIEYEHYQNQKIKNEKKIIDDRMMKAREYYLRRFSVNIPLQTCVVYFPHTIEYIMVEKPPEEGAELSEEPNEPVMVEKRVCNVATACSPKYAEFTVNEAIEMQLTEDKLNQMFFMDKELLESFPSELIDQLLSKKVFSVMLSMPVIKNEDVVSEGAAVDNEIPPDPAEHMGIVEQRLSTIIYGNGSPLNPSPDSFAVEHMIVNSSNVKIPSLYTPTNPLSKAAALAVLFKKFCLNNGYVPPQPPLPQYIVIFDIEKSNIVLPIIEDLEGKIDHYGFFRNADPENPILLCKDYELLTTYGMDKIGKDGKLVLSVLKDDNDKSLLRFVDVGPIYVSPDSDVGIDDAIKFFPHDFDQMDGEVKIWLAQQSAREEEAMAAVEDGDGEEHVAGEDEEFSRRKENEKEGEEERPFTTKLSTVS
ncbi:thioredoxin domain-containing protein 3-like isoform X2 [Sipha flava]|nr:thioredoxin domain-containing protein 3-like isoform X2 [Sipha flava]XP_025414203.1 thioredoxin domain-containing protein 3-like isoform X2 [Sipha flava]